MFAYLKKALVNLFGIIILLGISAANFYWPFYLWLGDTILYRFIWLGIFFVILDLVLEMSTKIVRNVKQLGELMTFDRSIKKMGDGFIVISNILFPNGLRADYLVIGSSGIWLITVREDSGKISFNGEDLVRDDTVLKGLAIESLEKSYTLTNLLKKELSRDFKVASVIVFISSQANIELLPKKAHEIYLSSGKDVLRLVDDTDSQLLDKDTINEISKIIKSRWLK